MIEFRILCRVITCGFKLGEVTEGDQRFHKSFSEGPRDEAMGIRERQARWLNVGESGAEKDIGRQSRLWCANIGKKMSLRSGLGEKYIHKQKGGTRDDIYFPR